MDADAAAELRSLRARAYGPGAGIHDDPEALQRLAELEALNRPSPAAAGAPGAPEAARPRIGEADPDGGEAGLGEAAADRAEDSAEDASPPPQADRRMRIWVPAVWVASLIVVAAVVGAWTLSATLAVFTPIQRDGVGRQVAVLEVDPDFESPPIFGQGDVGQVGFHDFHGLTVIATNATWMGSTSDPSARCLFVMRTDAVDPDSQSINGPIFNDCVAGSFPASIEVNVNSDLPDEIRERFPEGTALQFVLDGDRVGVFTDAG